MKNLSYLLSFITFSSAITAAKTVLLDIPGPDIGLGTATAELIDYTRTNTFGNNSDPRAILISVFYPVGEKPCSGGYQTEYVPQVVSDYEDVYFKLFGQLGEIDYEEFRSQFYRKCSGHHSSYPVVVFSPGYLRTRLLYGALAQSVAKSGYIVVTVDHPYDADIVVFPNGKIVYGINDANFSNADYQPAVDTRVADLKFLLDQLGNKIVAKKLLPTVPYDFDVHKVGMYGHSLGGAAIADAMIVDERIAGGINMDGSLFPPVTTEGLDRPFMLFGEATHTHFTDQSWNETWPLFRGWHEEISLNGSRHSTFGDLAFLVKTLGLTHTGNESKVVGTIDGGVAMEDERTVTTDFFNWIFHGIKSPLLEYDNTGYPDISYVTDACTPDVGCQE